MVTAMVTATATAVVHNATGTCHEALGTVPGEQAGTAFVINVNYSCN